MSPEFRAHIGDLGRHPDYEYVPGLLILRLDSQLFYANASLVIDRIKRTVGASDPLPKALILDLGANDELDITSIEQLEHLVQELRAGGIDFALADLRQPVLERLRRSGLLDLIGPDDVFLTVDEAVRARATRSQPTMSSA